MNRTSLLPYLLAGAAGAIVASTLPFLQSSTQAAPKLLPFQGRLTDASGDPIGDGPKVVQFKIYDAPTGGTAVWNGEVQKVTVNGGLVSTLLGSKADLSAVDFNAALYLEITVDANGDNQITAADPPLLPRQSILPAVFAVEASQMSIVNGAGKRVGGAGWDAIVSNATDPNPANWRIKTARISLPSTADASTGVFSIGDIPILHAFGIGNIFVGPSAGNFTMTGIRNTANGINALFSNTTGNDNTASGQNTLAFNSTGSNNTAEGASALYANSTGNNNTANGGYALHANEGGSQNTANGASALFSNTSGEYNTANGFVSLHNNTTGGWNTANGANSLSANTSGTWNIAVGVNAGINLTTGSYNIDIGNQGVAGEFNTIRLGSPGQQTATYIAGISGSTISGGQNVAVNSGGRLGVAAPRIYVATTGTKVGDIVASLSSGNAIGNSASAVDVASQSLTIITGGGPVFVCLTAAGNAASIGVNGGAGSANVVFSIWRDGVQQCSFTYISVGNTLGIPPGGIAFLDAVSAGSHSYQLKAQYTGTGGWSATNVRLTAIEY